MSKKAENAAAKSAAQTPEADLHVEVAGEDVLQAARAQLEDAQQALADTENRVYDAEHRAEAAEAALKAAMEATAAPAAYAGYQELPAAVASTVDLNLRAGPGLNFGVLEVLPDGDPVQVCPLPYGVAVPGWALIVSNSGTKGWAMTEFLIEPPTGG